MGRETDGRKREEREKERDLNAHRRVARPQPATPSPPEPTAPRMHTGDTLEGPTSQPYPVWVGTAKGPDPQRLVGWGWERRRWSVGPGSEWLPESSHTQPVAGRYAARGGPAWFQGRYAANELTYTDAPNRCSKTEYTRSKHDFGAFKIALFPARLPP